MRRTGQLKRTKMPARTGSLTRTNGLNSGAVPGQKVAGQKMPPLAIRKPSRDTGPSRKVRALVWERDQGTCVACGRVITPGMWWSLQHRLARGQGGGNDPTNLVILCGSATSAGCHRRAEDRDREYNARGYWLHSWEDPAVTPVMIMSPGGSGVTAWATADGRWIFEAPAGTS